MTSDKMVPFSDADQYGVLLHFEEEAGREAKVESPAPPFEPLTPFFVPTAKEAFPVEMLPAAAADMVNAVAESTQTTLDMAGTCVLAVLATAVQGKARIQMKPGWVEPLNLFCLVVAEPGERKSAVLAQMKQPIEDYERKANEAIRLSVERSRSEWRTLEAKQKRLETKLSKGDDPDTSRNLKEVNEQIAAFQPVNPIRLLVDDCTPEALTKLLSDSGGRISVFSAEGGIFDILNGSRFNTSVNMDVFLKGHAGDSIRVDRLNRPPEYIPHPALTVLLMAQPDVLRECINNQAFMRRGLMARFLIAWPESRVGKRLYDTPPIPEEVSAAYEKVVTRLLALGMDGDKPYLLRLDEKAQALSRFLFQDLEGQMTTDFVGMAGWPQKLHGVIGRIAGIIHLVEDPEDGVDTPVNEDDFLRAQTIGLYYLTHALTIFKTANVEETLAMKCLEKLRGLREKYGNSIWERKTVRNSLRGTLRKHGGKDALNDVLEELTARGYLRYWQGFTGEGNHRPTTYYELRKDEK